MYDDELVSTPLDKRRVGGGLPRHRARAATGNNGPGRATLWNARETLDFPAPSRPEALWGVYPLGFVEWAIATLQVPAAQVLHVCSGSLGPEVGGVRVDLRTRARPDVLADGRALPFRDQSFGGVLIDPPYSLEYARELYGTDYPRPTALLREAARVVRPCGRIGFLHFVIPMPARGTKLVSIRGITQGCGYRIRAYTLFVRDQDGLLL